MMRYIPKAIFVTLLLTITIQANDGKAVLQAMDLELKEAATIPAIMKDYVMVEMKNRFSDPESNLKREIEQFDSLQEKLALLPLEDEEKTMIKKHQEMWMALKAVLQQPVDKERFKIVKEHATPLRLSIKKMIRSFKAKLHNNQADALYYTGKLSAVSQKFASLYMLLKWGMDNEKLHKDMIKQKEMYGNALEKLSALNLTGTATKELLPKLKKDLGYFDFLEQRKTFAPALVYKKTNSMYDHTNEMMEALLKE